MTLATQIIIWIAAAMLVAAAVLTLIRASRGPSALDRMVASDVMVGIVIAGLALEAALHRHAITFPVMLVLSLCGFVGAVSMARFMSRPGSGNKGGKQ